MLQVMVSTWHGAHSLVGLGTDRTQNTENTLSIQASSYIKWYSTFTILQTTKNPFQIAPSNLPAHPEFRVGWVGPSARPPYSNSSMRAGFIPRYTHMWNFTMLLWIPPLILRALTKSKPSRRHKILTLRIHNYTIWNILHIHFKEGLLSSGSRHASYICTTHATITMVAALPSRFAPLKWFDASIEASNPHNIYGGTP